VTIVLWEYRSVIWFVLFSWTLEKKERWMVQEAEKSRPLLCSWTSVHSLYV